MPLKSINQNIGIWEMKETSEEMLSLLNQKEVYREKLSSFKAEQRKKEWLASRLLLKEMLGIETEIHHKESGAPFLPTEFNKNISISHTKNYAAIMLSDKPQSSGIDIEYQSERVVKVRHRFMNPEEEAFIDPQHEVEHLLICWCAKETLYKIINRQEVDFCRHLHIQPFSFSKNGVFYVFETYSKQELHFKLTYQVNEEFVITYLVNE